MIQYVQSVRFSHDTSTLPVSGRRRLLLLAGDKVLRLLHLEVFDHCVFLLSCADHDFALVSLGLQDCAALEGPGAEVEAHAWVLDSRIDLLHDVLII